MSNAVSSEQIGGRRSLALASVCTLLFLTFLDNTIVSVALGDIQKDTHAGVQALQWIVNGYALVFASMMLVAGAFGDRFGHRAMMLAGASVFAAGSIVCALAATSGVLIGGRAVMGLGAAASEPATLAMLRHLYPGRRERARATGVWAAVSALALALGPVIGGLIVGVASWHWIFWFNLAFALAALAVGWRLLPETTKAVGRPVDALGAVLGAGALAMLVFAVLQGETGGFVAVDVITLFCCATLAAIAFVWWERRAPQPLLDLEIVRSPVFAASNVVAFAAYFGTFAVFFFCALYLHAVADQSGVRIAVEFVPMAVATILACLATGRWLGRVGVRAPVVLGCLLFAAGLVVTERALSPHQPYLPIAASLTLVGVGVGLVVVPTTFAAVSAAPLRRAGMASSAVNTSREVGAVAGTAVLGAIVYGDLLSQLTAQLDKLGYGQLKPIIIPMVVHGGGGLTGSDGGSSSSLFHSIGQKVLPAVYRAFGAGLHASLLVAAVVVLVAGVIAAVAMRRDASAAAAGDAAEIGLPDGAERAAVR